MIVDTKIFQRIKNLIPNLSKGQLKIVSFLLDNYNESVVMTAKEIAKELNISESTVVRFSKRIGFEGFLEFQKALKEEIRNIVTINQKFDMFKFPDSIEKVIQKSFYIDQKLIKKTLENLDYSKLEIFCKSIIESNRIYLLGLRSSRILTEYLQYYLQFFNSNIINLSTSTIDYIDCFLDTKEDDIAIVFSFPRYTTHTVDLVKRLKLQNIKILLITDSEDSPLCEFADETMFVYYELNSFIDSHVPSLVLINSIIMGLAYYNPDKTKKQLLKLEELWKTHKMYI